MNNPVVNALIVSSLTFFFNRMGNIILRLMHNLKEKLNSQLKKGCIFLSTRKRTKDTKKAVL